MPLPPIAIVISRYNRAVTDRLLAGAIEAYTRLGGERDHLTVVDAAGAFEIPYLAATARDTRKVAGIVAIGCIIKGETNHDEVLGHAVTTALMNLSTNPGSLPAPVPVGLAVLTVNTPQQALARAGGPHGNKGAEAMLAVLQSLSATVALRGGTALVGGVNVVSTSDLASVPSPAETSHDKLTGEGR